MRILKGVLLYATLIFLTAVMVGVGFQTAEKGIQAMIGTEGPPKTVHLQADSQTVRMTVMGKQMVQPKPALGDQWSRQLEATKTGLGDTLDALNFQIGKLLQSVMRKAIEFVSSLTLGIFR